MPAGPAAASAQLLLPPPFFPLPFHIMYPACLCSRGGGLCPPCAVPCSRAHTQRHAPLPAGRDVAACGGDAARRLVGCRCSFSWHAWRVARRRALFSIARPFDPRTAFDCQARSPEGSAAMKAPALAQRTYRLGCMGTRAGFGHGMWVALRSGRRSGWASILVALPPPPPGGLLRCWPSTCGCLCFL